MNDHVRQFRFMLLSTVNPVPFPAMSVRDVAFFQRWCGVMRDAVVAREAADETA